VHTWFDENGEEIRIELGTKYGESLRLFLLGKRAIPFEAALLVVACTDKINQEIFMAPSTDKKPDHRVFGFVARGLTFMLSIGKRVPAVLRIGSVVNTTEEWILTKDCMRHPIWQLSQD
jgi:hypothetical protein